MSLYLNSPSKVRFAGGLSGQFPIRVGVHQGSAPSPLLFKIVMEEVTEWCRKGNPWELLYADDLVLTAETKQEVESIFRVWSDAMERCGMKVNITKTKLLVSGKKRNVRTTSGRECDPCGI